MKTNDEWQRLPDSGTAIKGHDFTPDGCKLCGAKFRPDTGPDGPAQRYEWNGVGYVEHPDGGMEKKRRRYLNE